MTDESALIAAARQMGAQFPKEGITTPWPDQTNFPSPGLPTRDGLRLQGRVTLVLMLSAYFQRCYPGSNEARAVRQAVAKYAGEIDERLRLAA